MTFQLDYKNRKTQENALSLYPRPNLWILWRARCCALPILSCNTCYNPCWKFPGKFDYVKKNRLFLLDSPYPVKIIKKKGMVSIWIHSRQKSWLECILFSRWSSHLWHSSAVVLQRAHNVWTGKEQLDLFLCEINQCHCKLCWYFDCFLRKFKIV